MNERGAHCVSVFYGLNPRPMRMMLEQMTLLILLLPCLNGKESPILLSMMGAAAKQKRIRCHM